MLARWVAARVAPKGKRMALVRCPDCNREVSEAAPVCPGCGRPIAQTQQFAQPMQVQATQGATGKFLDPGANMRSCLGCIGLIFLLIVVFMIWRVLA